MIRSYVNHECERTNLSIQLWRFFEENKTLLLPKEIAISEAMKVNLKPELLLFSTGRQYLGKRFDAKVNLRQKWGRAAFFSVYAIEYCLFQATHINRLMCLPCFQRSDVNCFNE